MRFSSTIAVLLSLATAFAQNKTIIVKVGENNGTTFDPPSVTANNGDTVAFQFLAKNHTVTQSTFATPCQIMTTPNAGIDSGFQAVTPGAAQVPQWSVTVTNSSTPLWFFCRQTGHCQKGMVFAVNPTAAKNYSTFLANAMASNSSGSTSGGAPIPSSSGSGVSASNLPSASPNEAPALYPGNAAVIATLLGLVAGLVL
jgi:plastocyanin